MHYPFGSLLPGRSTPGTAYRYGFQGQEKDNELKGEGNSLNYTFRMHDPRVGRFFAVDPLASKYPYLSTYQFSSNTPIIAIELEGLETGYTNSLDRMDAKSELRLQESNRILKAKASAELVKLGFNHYLPKKFIDFYTGGTGGNLILTNTETIDLHSSAVSIMQGRRKEEIENENENFNKEFTSLKKGESKKIKLSVQSKANTQGTLGTFKINFDGILTKGKDGESWTFSGTMQFYDEWDFDTKKSGLRTSNSESATGLGDALLTGKGFKIYSPIFKVTETNETPAVDWFDNKDETKVDTKSKAGKSALYAKEVYDIMKKVIVK